MCSFSQRFLSKGPSKLPLPDYLTGLLNGFALFDTKRELTIDTRRSGRAVRRTGKRAWNGVSRSGRSLQ